MSLPCSIEEIIDKMPYIAKASIIRMNSYRVELLSTHFYPEQLRELEALGWIMEDPMSVVKYHQTDSEPEQKLMRVTLTTKQWKEWNEKIYRERIEKHDALTVILQKVNECRDEVQPFFVPDD